MGWVTLRLKAYFVLTRLRRRWIVCAALTSNVRRLCALCRWAAVICAGTAVLSPPHHFDFSVRRTVVLSECLRYSRWRTWWPCGSGWTTTACTSSTQPRLLLPPQPPLSLHWRQRPSARPSARMLPPPPPPPPMKMSFTCKLSIHLSINPFIYPTLHPSIYLSILSIYLSIYLSICIYKI